MRTAIGLGLSASRHLICRQATSKNSDIVVPVHADLPPGPDEAVTFLVHYGVSEWLLINVAAQFVKVLLCLLFPAILRIPGPDPPGSRMPSSQESVVHPEERLRCDGNVSVSLCSLQRYQARHQLTGPACTQIWNSDQSGRIGPEMRAGSGQRDRDCGSHCTKPKGCSCPATRLNPLYPLATRC